MKLDEKLLRLTLNYKTRNKARKKDYRPNGRIRRCVEPSKCHQL